ncbi:MAG: ATP-binding protein [Vicinamibacterales bacterium]|jgi:hypothetical protein|nr:ATP-binding protein [Vicinamibacterales bacterium]
MATVHLICGLPGAGKTTYATGLQADLNSVLFSLDRWLVTSHGRYSLATVGHEEHTRRVLACRALMWGVAAELLRRSVDVILDDGFFFRQDRMRTVDLARTVGVLAKIHLVNTPIRVIRSRLRERNANLPPHNFEIDPETLTGFLELFEPPTEDEGAEVVVTGEPTQLAAGNPTDSRIHGGA